ncbi:MAG: hypothetical protein DRJ38_02020 [Thermoprotei archaeon]|nr:MAG: hypothetical protein DRJ38_02020 [Thermoprotei archaeon]
MKKLKKLIVVTAQWDPVSSKILKIINRIAEKYNLNVEKKEEDWIFLKKYGEKDELGGADIPQVFIELEDGSIIHVLTKLPLNEEGKADEVKAEKIIEEKIASLL